MSENSGGSSQPRQQPEATGTAGRGDGGARPQQSPPPAGGTADNPLRGSRTSGVWIATAGVGILLVLLVIFIVQNTQEVDIAYLGWEGRLPLAAALLIAAAAGILITTTAGGLRILQLRRRVKRDSKALKKARKAERASAPGQGAPPK